MLAAFVLLFLRLSRLTPASPATKHPGRGSISAIFWTAVTVGERPEAKGPSCRNRGGASATLLASGAKRLPVGQVTGPVTTPRRSYPTPFLFPTRPRFSVGGFCFQDFHFEHAQRRVPQGRGADSLRPQSAHARRRADRQDRGQHRRVRLDDPILVDGDNGIIAGHGRLAAARKLGLDQVPVIELAHLTVAQKRATSSPTTGWRSTPAGTRDAGAGTGRPVRGRDTTWPDRLRGCRDRGAARRCRWPATPDARQSQAGRRRGRRRAGCPVVAVSRPAMSGPSARTA